MQGLGLRPGAPRGFSLLIVTSPGAHPQQSSESAALRVPQQSVFSSYMFLVYFYISGGSTDSCTRLKSTKEQPLCLPFS